MKDSVLKIEPIKPLEEGEFMTGYNTKISLGGREVRGVESIDIAYRPDDVVRAKVGLLAIQHEVDALKCTFQIYHPGKEEWVSVKGMVLEDGEMLEFDLE